MVGGHSESGANLQQPFSEAKSMRCPVAKNLRMSVFGLPLMMVSARHHLTESVQCRKTGREGMSREKTISIYERDDDIRVVR
jgi:hypothetical protein